MAFCAGCGAQMADGATVCAACGKGQSVGGGAAAAPAQSTSSAGMNDNVAGLLAYFFIPAIIFLLVEPYNRNKFVRFHSFQGLFLGLFSFAGHIVLGIIPILGWIILPFFSLLILVLAIVGAVKAFQGGKWMMPVIGEMAQKQADAS